MGGAEAATSPTGKAQKAEVVGGRFESDQRSHQEALGGVSQGSTGGCKIETVSPQSGRKAVAPFCFSALPAAGRRSGDNPGSSVDLR